MNKFKQFRLLSLLIFAVVLIACGNNDIDDQEEGEEKNYEKEKRMVEFLGHEHEIPTNVERLVIGDESMLEEALLFGVEPTATRELPMTWDVFSELTRNTEVVDPDNYENLLELEPDVILYGSTYSPDDFEEMQNIAPTIIIPLGDGSVWKERLQLFAEITQNEDQVEPIIDEYNALVEKAQNRIDTEGKTVLTLRIRGENAVIYPENTYVNDLLYNDIGFEPPKEILNVTQQEQISMEGLASIDPDYLFVQVTEPAIPVWKELQNSGVWSTLTAVQENNVYENVMEPELSGASAYSKIRFIEGVIESVVE